jgi:hypothetical protein
MNEHTIAGFILEDSVAAADAFAAAKRVEDHVRATSTAPNPLVLTNFTGSFETISPPAPPRRQG